MLVVGSLPNAQTVCAPDGSMCMIARWTALMHHDPKITEDESTSAGFSECSFVFYIRTIDCVCPKNARLICKYRS